MSDPSAQTIRFPAGVLSEAREVKAREESMNDFVVNAVIREVRRRRGLRAFAEIRRLRDDVKARRGLHPSSVTLIRALREGEGRHD